MFKRKGIHSLHVYDERGWLVTYELFAGRWHLMRRRPQIVVKQFQMLPRRQ